MIYGCRELLLAGASAVHESTDAFRVALWVFSESLAQVDISTICYPFFVYLINVLCGYMIHASCVDRIWKRFRRKCMSRVPAAYHSVH